MSKRTSGRGFTLPWAAEAYSCFTPLHRTAFTTADKTAQRGYTVIELLIVVAITIIVVAIAVPQTQSAVASYRLRSAVGTVTGAIQSTRYQAISQGYPFAVAFSQAGKNYQISSDPTRTSNFKNVGSAIPLGNSIILGGDTTLQFHPSGIVQSSVGSMTLTVSNGARTATIKVTTYGSATVTYAP